MSFQNKSVIGWAFVMVAFSVIPYSTTVVTQPSGLFMVGLLIGIGLVSAVVGNLFKD